MKHRYHPLCSVTYKSRIYTSLLLFASSRWNIEAARDNQSMEAGRVCHFHQQRFKVKIALLPSQQTEKLEAHNYL